jgi:uncharacterized protein (TIGR02145 family)
LPVPTDEDWTNLHKAVGTMSATKLKAVDGWSQSRNGSDALGFNGVPAASRDLKGRFSVPGEQANWWSSTEEGYNIYWAFYYNINFKAGELFKAPIAKGSGFSVRCIRD